MPARRVPALALPVDPGAAVSFPRLPEPDAAADHRHRPPGAMVTLTLPEHLEAGHVQFARQLAVTAWAYAVAVERRYRGLPALPGQLIPHVLTAKADTWTGDPRQSDVTAVPARQEVTA